MSEEHVSNPPIRFEGYKIESIEYGQSVNAEDHNFKLGYSMNDDSTEAAIRIRMGFENEDKQSRGIVEVVGHFSLKNNDSGINPVELVLKNGAAMLYPYVRTIISMLTALDDSRVSVMPTLNFVEMFEEHESKKTNE